MRIVRVLFPQQAVRILPANVDLRTLYFPIPGRPKITVPGDYVISAFGAYPAVLLAIDDIDDEEQELKTHTEGWKRLAIEIWENARLRK